MEKESHSGVERQLNSLHSPRTPMEEMFCHFFLKAEEIFKPFIGRNDDCPIQRAINRFEEIINDIRSKYSIDDVYTGDFGEIGVGSQSDPFMVQDALLLRHIGKYIMEDRMLKADFSIQAGRSHTLPLKRSSKGVERSLHAHKILLRSPSPDHSGNDVLSLSKKRAGVEAIVSDICGESVHPPLITESLAVPTHGGGVCFSKSQISEEILKHMCTGRQRSDELVTQILGLMTHLGVALDEWNTEFVKVKYLQGEYGQKMSTKAKEVVTLEDQLDGCRTELTNMSTSLSLQRQEVERSYDELIEARTEIRQKEKKFRALAVENEALELERKVLEDRLSEKELMMSETKANEISLKAVEDFKNSLAHRTILEDYVEEARHHILNVEVKDLERQCLEEGFIRGFLKGIRLVNRRTGASIDDLSLSQISEDISSDSGDEEAESAFKRGSPSG